MADRTVTTTLLLKAQQYLSEWDRVQKKTRDSTTDAKAKLEEQRGAWKELGGTALIAGAAVAAGVGLAISRYVEFDKAMSNVKAATQETASNMVLLRAAALDAGAKTVFTAVEAANAIEELGKNGLSTAQILGGGLSGALSLASAGQLDVARAAEVMSLSMKQFGLAGKDIPHIADLLAAGAGKAAGDVEDMAQALAQGGLVAHATGLSIEETTGVLAAFADNALIGSDAGTSLKTMLQRLTPTSVEAKKEMDRLGISAYDAQGNFIGAAAFAGNLHESLKGLTAEQRNSAEATIFGSDAVRAANVLYEQGAEGIQKYINQTNDSGYAAKVAADRLDNLAGDIEKLGGSMDTALIQTGSGANDTLRQVVQSATFLVDTFGSLPQPVLATGLALGTTAAALLLTGGAAMTALPRIATFKTSLDTLKISAKGTAIAVGAVGAAVTLATLIIGQFLAAEAQKASNVEAFGDSLDKATGKVTAYTRELVAKRLQDEGVYDAAEQAGIGIDLVTKAAGGNKKAIAELNKQTGEWLATQSLTDRTVGGAGIAYDKLTDSVRFVREDIDKAKAAHENLAEAQGATTGTTEALTAATEAQAAADEAATEAHDELVKSYSEADSSFVNLQGAYDGLVKKNQEYAQSVADSTKNAKDTWQDYYDGQSFNIDEYVKELQRQVEAQTNWEKNISILSGSLNAGALKHITDMGDKGAPLVQGLVDAINAGRGDVVDALNKTFDEGLGAGVDTFAQGAIDNAPIFAEVGATYGSAAVAALADKVSKGEGIDQALDDLGLKLQSNPVAPAINTAPALAAFDSTEAYAAAMQIWLTAQGDAFPAREAFATEREYQEGVELWLKANGNTAPARKDFDSAEAYAEAMDIWLTGMGNTKPARGDFDSAKSYGDALKAWITAMANTDGAEAALNRAARNRDMTINATMRTSGVGDIDHNPATPYATGGAIYGAGTGTSDSVPIWASTGEHMWTAAEVAAAGGQAAMYAMRAAVRSGRMPRYAGGGAIARERVQYVPMAAASFSSGSSSRGNLSVSLAGARVVLEVGGRQIEGVIREQAGIVVGAAIDGESVALAQGFGEF